MVPSLGTTAESGPGAVAPRAGARASTSARVLAQLLRLPLLVVAIRRVLLAVPLLLAVSLLSFVLEYLTPGDPARAILGVHATTAEYQHLRTELGLNHPLSLQYWDWFRGAIHGNLGVSLYSGEAVTHAVSNRLPVTISLIVGALLVTVIVGVPLGALSAVRGGVIGRAVDALSMLGFALPAFWVGALLIVLFAVDTRWLPATGYVPLSQSLTGWLRSLVLPVGALALNGIAAVARQTREAMLEALGSEYVRVARANGISERSIVLRHALRNSGMRIVTVLGIQAVVLLGGTVLVENVFALPGLGGLLVTAAIQHDVPVVQGIVVCFTLIVVAVNLAIDLSYAWLDPRVRAS